MIRFGALSASLVGAALLAGCSPLVDRTNSPDAPPVPPDETAPAIASSNPANNGTHSVIQPVVVYLDEDLDPASVSSASVTLEREVFAYPPLFPTYDPFFFTFNPTPPGLYPRDTVTGTVSYDEATRQVSFVPSRPLAYGTNYTLALSSLKDLAGNELTTTITFRTYINLETRVINFNSSGTAVSNYGRSTLNASGRPDDFMSYSAGTDNLWFTTDDAVSSRFSFQFDARGRILDERARGAGPDARLGTSDDTVQSLVGYASDAMGNTTGRTFYNGPGPDTVWGTTDDQIQEVQALELMGTRVVGTIYYVTPGPDTIWRTSDDRCQSVWNYEYDAAGRKTRAVYRTCGVDQLPRNADDVDQFLIVYAYDSSGRLIKTDLRNGPGADNMWNTADDSRFSIRVLEYDAQDRVVRGTTYRNAGVDAMWDTADDVPGQGIDPALERFSYDSATGLLSEHTIFGAAGVDNTWGTEDDVILNYTRYTYNDLGLRTDSKRYTAGADGMWRTADDVVVLDFDYELSR